ncbi:MAG: AAA family ATPase [Thermanaerothrix sp.]|nr:AAA family ATPase [Thermanaerothrix sp.]
MSSLEARLIGPFRIYRDGAETVLPFKKAYGLLAYVLVNRRVQRARLEELFWGDFDRPRASGSLRNALYELKRYLSDGAIRTDRLWVIRGDGWNVDLDLLVEGAFSQVPQGDFLEGLSLPDCPAFEEWVESMRMDVAERVRRSLLRGPWDAERLSELWGLFNRAPCDEELALGLMDCLAHLGRPGEALRTFARLKRALNEEGEEPSQEAVHLKDRLVGLMMERSNLVGRGLELRRVLEFAGSSGPAALWVFGQAGVGKTSFARELARLCGVPSLWARPVMGKLPLWPFEDLLRGLVAKGLMDGEASSSPLFLRLGQVFPSLGVRASDFQPVDSRSIGAMVFHLLSTVCRRSFGLWVFFDDLHRFDEASMDALEGFLGSMDSRCGIRVGLISRPRAGSMGRLLRSLMMRGDLKVLEMELEPLSQEDTGELFRRLSRRTLGEAELLDLYDRTCGVPLFVEEAAKGPSIGGQTFVGAVEGLMGELSGDEWSVMEALAVLDGPVGLEELKAIALPGREGFPFLKVLNSLEGLRLIRVEEGPDGPAVDVYHGLFRECIYLSMEASRRMELHAMAGEAFRSKEDPFSSMRAAHHMRKGGNLRGEIEVRLRDLERHMELHYELFPLLPDHLLGPSSFYGAREATEEMLEECRSLMSAIGAGDDLASRYMMLKGGFLLWWGEYHRGLGMTSRGAEMALRAGDLDVLAGCLRRLGYFYIQVEDPAMLEETALKLRDIKARLPLKGLSLRFMGLSRMFSGRLGEALRLFEASAGEFEMLSEMGVPHELNRLAAGIYGGECLFLLGRLDEGIARVMECLGSVRSRGFMRVEPFVLSVLARLKYLAGDLEGAFAHAEEALGIFSSMPWVRDDGPVLAVAALHRGLQGRMEEAAGLMRRAVNALSIGKPSWRVFVEELRRRMGSAGGF